MDVHGSVSLKMETESSLPSPKRPRIDYIVTFDNTSTDDLPNILTSQTVGSPSVALPRDADVICTEQNRHIQDKKPCEQIHDTILTAGPQAEDTTSNTLEVCVSTEVSQLLHLKQYDQQDKISPSPLSGSYTLEVSTSEMSSYPECQHMKNSLEDKSLADCSLPSKNGLSNDAEVRYQSGSPCDSNQHETAPGTCSQSVAFDDRNQKEEDFADTIFQQGVKQDEGEKSLSHMKEFQLFVSPPDKDVPVILAGDKRKVDMCDSAAACDRETNDQANDTEKSDIASPVECAEVSLISYHATPAKYISTETENPDDFGQAGGEHSETAAETEKERVHHMPENHMPASISIESAEKDNDADLHRVSEFTVWSKTVREAEENCYNSKSIAGEQLPPSVMDCELEIPHPPTSDAGPLQPASDQTVQSINQYRPQQHEDKKENLSESFSVPSSGTHNTSGYEDSCHLTSSPCISPQRTTKPLPAGDGIHSCVIAGHHLEDQSSCLPVSCNYLKAQHVEHSLPGIGTRDEPKEIKEMTGEIKPHELVMQQNSPSNEDMSEQSLVEGLTEDTKLTPGEETVHVITHQSFPEYQQTAEMLECKDELLPSLSDAVVPGPHELSPRHHSPNPDRVLAQNCKDKFASLPSAFAIYTHVSGGFDNFHKIQLSPDDDEAVQGNDCPHTSLAMLLMKSPQKDHSMPKREGQHVEMPKEMEQDQVHEGGGKVECHIQDLASGGFDTEANCTKGLSEEDVIVSEFSNDAAVHNSPPPFPIQWPEFKMKKEFDLVLKELNVYFNICKSEIACDNGKPPELGNDVLCNEVSKSKCHSSSPELALHRDSALGPDENHSVEICVTDPDACCITSHGGEQEVPIGCHVSPEGASLAAAKHRAPLLEAKRLQPLTTCTRPIRLGLSKRAKPKPLHRFHPYI
ncbi:uncharacterized protein LOC144039233 isoform X2 [Vanacampus margaritifer]